MRDEPELGDFEYWDGITDEFDKVYQPGEFELKMRAKREKH